MQGEVVQLSKDSITGESDVNTDVLGPEVHGSSLCHHALSKENPRGANPSLQLCIKPPQQPEIILMKYLPSHPIHTPYLCQKDSPGPKATPDNEFSPTCDSVLGGGVYCWSISAKGSARSFYEH